MRKRLSIFACLGMMAVAVAIAAGSGSESEARPKPRDFVIAGSDGYGTQDCLASKGDCGRIVADAWCESKGFKAALAYRKLSPDEITGTTGTARNPVDSFLISCRE